MAFNNIKTKNSHHRLKALMGALCISLYIVVLTYIFWKISALIASYILILTIISSIFYFLVSKSNEYEEEQENILSINELKGTSRLLRYATTVLSFVSLMTTAQGLKDFVFSESEG